MRPLEVIGFDKIFKDVESQETMKRCPFCGSKPYLRQKFAKNGKFIFIVFCGNCGAKIKDKNLNPDYAVNNVMAKWNKRGG